MAIQLEFTSIIVPIAKIIAKLGRERFKARYEIVFDPEWRDEHLFREGAMNPINIDEMLNEWEEIGFQCIAMIDGQKHWKDLCLVDYYKGPTYPCTWLSFDPADHCVWLVGQPRGKAIGPSGRDVISDPVILDI